MPRSNRNGQIAADEENRANRRRRRHRDDGVADVASADANLFLEAVSAVTASKCTIQFGYTLDGGAISIRIFGDGDEPIMEYVRPSEDFDTYLRGLVEDYSL